MGSLPPMKAEASKGTDTGQCTYMSGKYFIHLSKTITYVHYMLYLAGFKARRILTLNLLSSYILDLSVFSNMPNISLTVHWLFYSP